MTLGSRIHALRTARNLSQEALAQQLNVSRQSVSKWETDAAIPDLDKMIKLCDVFNVTLDELAGRPAQSPPVEPAPASHRLPCGPQRVIGYILFGFSLLLIVLALLWASAPDSLLLLIPAAAILICALLCLFAGSRAVCWCIWVLGAPVFLLTPWVVRIGTYHLLRILLLCMVVLQVFITRRAYRDILPAVTRRRTILLILGWLVLAGLSAVNAVVWRPWAVPGTLLQAARYALLALLETCTVCYLPRCVRRP